MNLFIIKDVKGNSIKEFHYNELEKAIEYFNINGFSKNNGDYIVFEGDFYNIVISYVADIKI